MGPLASERRHPADYRDELEHAEVWRVLELLPWDHPAVLAYRWGKAPDSISLGYMLADRMELVERLTDVYFAGLGRVWNRGAGAGHVARQAPVNYPAYRGQGNASLSASAISTLAG